MKAKVHTPDRNTDFFDFVAEVLQGWYISTIFVYNLSRLQTSNVNRSNKRKWLYDKKKPISRWYPAESLIEADYKDNLVLLANTPA